MKQTRYITTTIQADNRLEIDVPNLLIGQTIEVILIIPDASESHPRSIDDFFSNYRISKREASPTPNADGS